MEALPASACALRASGRWWAREALWLVYQHSLGWSLGIPPRNRVSSCRHRHPVASKCTQNPAQFSGPSAASPPPPSFWSGTDASHRHIHRLKLAAAKREPFFLMRLGSSGESTSSSPFPTVQSWGELAGRLHSRPRHRHKLSPSLCSRPAAPAAVLLGRGLFFSRVSSHQPQHESSLVLKGFCWTWVVGPMHPPFLCCLLCTPEHYAFGYPILTHTSSP